MYFLCWGGCATLFSFSPKIHKLAPFLLRSCYIISFFANNLWVSTFVCWGCATQLPFSLPTVWQGVKGIASKAIPCAFSCYQRDPKWKHVSASSPQWHSSGASSPSLVRYDIWWSFWPAIVHIMPMSENLPYLYRNCGLATAKLYLAIATLGVIGLAEWATPFWAISQWSQTEADPSQAMATLATGLLLPITVNIL